MLSAGGHRHSGMQQQPAVLLTLVVLLASAMVLRLGWLQLVQGQENRARADENRIRLVPRHPMRGRILDRNGQVLVSSRLTYNLYVQPRQVPNAQWPALRDRLAQVIGVTPAALDERRRNGTNEEGYRIELVYNLKPEQVLRFREQAANLRARSELMSQITAIVKESNWTQTEAAQRCGVTQPRMNDLLRGRVSRFSLDALVNIATAMGREVHFELQAA